MRVSLVRNRRARPWVAAALVGGLSLLVQGEALRADTVVQSRGGQVDVTATAAPLSEVLDRIAKQTGMKVVYDGPQPRTLVTLRIEKATAAQAVLAALEGLGLGYLLRMDATGTRVETLMMITSRSASAAGPRPTSNGGMPTAFPPQEERVQLPDPVEEVDAVDDQPVGNEGSTDPPPQLPGGFPPFGGGQPGQVMPGQPGQLIPGLNGPVPGGMPVLPGPLQPGMMPVPLPGGIQPGMQPGMVPPPGMPFPPQIAPSPAPGIPQVPS